MERLDILNRETFVEQLVQLTERIAESEKSVSFAVDGKWGCGKSFVLDMFNERLEQIQSEETSVEKYLIIRYNCWKYDYYEEPLIAIVSTILDTITQKTTLLKDEQKEKIKGVLKAIGATFLSVINNALKNATGIDLKDAYSVVEKGIDTGETAYEKMHEYDIYFGFKKALDRLQDVINEISGQYHLVFLIDELDRCLPEYAIKVLERLHHLTENTKRVISVITIDKAQLQESIKYVLGTENAEGYLKKFIQFTVPLDIGQASEQITKKYPEYMGLFDKSILSVEDSIEEFMQAVFKDIEIREQEQIIHKAMFVHKLLYKEIKDYSFMCVEVLMTVIYSCYDGEPHFTRWFDELNKYGKKKNNTPSFSMFFEKKFGDLSYGEKGEKFYDPLWGFTFRVNTLYSSIAYIWYEMFFKNPYRYISILDPKTNKRLTNNVEELKKFLDLIKIIK